MTTPLKATYRQPDGKQDYTPTVAAIAGDIVRLGDGRIGVIIADLAANQKGAVYTEGIFDMSAASATVFAAGEEVWFDATNNLAVQATSATASYIAGRAVAAKISGDASVRIELNATTEGGILKQKDQLADGTTLTNLTAETVMATYTVPANSLKVGNVLDFFAAIANPSTNSTDTSQFRVRLNGLAGTVIADTGAIDLANNDAAVLSGQINIRSDGAGGTFQGAGVGTMKTSALTSIGSGSIDTTVGTVTLVITGQVSVANAGNQAICKQFNVFQR